MEAGGGREGREVEKLRMKGNSVESGGTICWQYRKKRLVDYLLLKNSYLFGSTKYNEQKYDICKYKNKEDVMYALKKSVSRLSSLVVPESSLVVPRCP